MRWPRESRGSGSKELEQQKQQQREKKKKSHEAAEIPTVEPPRGYNVFHTSRAQRPLDGSARAHAQTNI